MLIGSRKQNKVIWSRMSTSEANMNNGYGCNANDTNWLILNVHTGYNEKKGGQNTHKKLREQTTT